MDGLVGVMVGRFLSRVFCFVWVESPVVGLGGVSRSPDDWFQRLGYDF